MHRLEKETGMKINILRTDNGLEYVNKELSEILFIQRTVVDTPQPYFCWL